MSDVQPAKRIFISYSRTDAAFVAALRKHLKGLEDSGAARVWADDRIRVGERWSEVLEGEIASADIALLLVSADFLASEFIQTRELPALRAREPQLRIVPLVVRDVDWQGLALSSYQALREAKPIGEPGNDPAWTQAVAQLRAQFFVEGGDTAGRKSVIERIRVRWIAFAIVLTAVLSAGGYAWWKREHALAQALATVEGALDRGDRAEASARLAELGRAWSDRAEVALGKRVAGLYGSEQGWDPQRFEDEVAQLMQLSAAHGQLFAPHTRTARAGKLLYAGELARAQEQYEKAVNERPGLVEAQLALGVLGLWRDELDTAIERFGLVLTLAPEDSRAKAGLAEARARRGDTSSARRLYAEVLRADADYLPPYLDLARLQRSAGDARGSLATLRRIEGSFDRAVELPKNDPPFGYRVGPSVARAAKLAEPPLIFLQGPARKRYYYRLSMALSACLAGDDVQPMSSLTGLTPDDISRVRLLLLDELNADNHSCMQKLDALASTL